MDPSPNWQVFIYHLGLPLIVLGGSKMLPTTHLLGEPFEPTIERLAEVVGVSGWVSPYNFSTVPI